MSALFPIGNDGKLTSEALSQACDAMAGNDGSELWSIHEARALCCKDQVTYIRPRCNGQACSLGEIQQSINQDVFNSCVSNLAPSLESTLDPPIHDTASSKFVNKVEDVWNEVFPW